jgi:hypothetical protein
MKKYLFLLIPGLMLMLQSNAHVNILSPLGGEIYYPGDTVNIQWEVVVPHNTLDWDLLFSGDGGVIWDTVQADIPLATLNFQWIVPATATSQGRIRIVQDNVSTDYDDSSGDFSIILITGIRREQTLSKAKVYPNPFSETAIIKLANPMNESRSLNIYNTCGQLVRCIDAINNEKIVFEKGDLWRGNYFYHIESSGQIRASGRLVIL